MGTYRDHPRSRGVYEGSLGACRNPLGSSPLARGLPVLGPVEARFARIIPARAGFTFAFPHPLPHPTDHPRSRGVYKTHDAQHRKSPGSSPLARGLPCVYVWVGMWSGIIPARAGFTAPSSCASRPGGDHPRSRGVYQAEYKAVQDQRGSSPLARGLRESGGVERAVGRIIPARAGFTPLDSSSPSEYLDHPRSRGVYEDSTRAGAARSGSSPLARGLPSSPHFHTPTRGIIPARAGFTLAWVCLCLNLWDHPRSRGVYSVHRHSKQ